MKPKMQKKTAATNAGRRHITIMMIATKMVVINMIAVNVTPAPPSFCLLSNAELLCRLN